MSWITDIMGLTTKAAPVRTDDDHPRQPRAVFYRQSRPVVVYDNFCKAEAALQNPVIQRCLRIISRAVQSVDWYAEGLPGKQVAKRDIDDINDLLASPNDDYTAATMRYWMALNMAVYARIPIKIGIGARNIASGIYPLDARFLRVESDASGRISRYMYGAGENEQTFPAKMRRGVQREGFAYQIQSPGLSGDPSTAKDQLVPLRSLGGPSQVIDALMMRTIATANGHPNAKYIISTEHDLTEDQITAVEEYMGDHDTFGSHSGEIMFVRGVKLNVTKLDSDLSDIHSKMPMDDMTRMIFGAYGIPISMAGLGAADAAKYASNFGESRQSFYTDTIIPEYLSPIADGLTHAICPPGIRIRFDIDSIAALLPSRMETAATLEGVTYLTQNEKRQLVGFGSMEQADE